MKQLQFTKKDTNIAKGLFLIMMIIHHLFYDYDTFGNFNVSFVFLSAHQVIVIAQYFKLCIAGFTMLTFYGMTKKYMQLSQEAYSRQIVPNTINKIISLVMSFLFVYVLSAITALALKDDLTMLYSRNEKSWLGYAVVDALGMADFFHTPTLNVTWWYMSFVIVLIFLFPIYYKLYQRLGVITVPVAALLPGALLMEQTYYGLCAFSMILGIFAAETDLFVRMRKFGCGNKIIKGAKCIVCAATFLITYQLLFYGISVSLYFGIGAVLWTYVSYEFLAPLKGVGGIVSFIGKHSMNIFLTHTFLYYYYAKDFIYSFGSGIMIVTVLLGCSLVISVCIEGLKKAVRYSKLINYLQVKAVYCYDSCRRSGFSNCEENT